MAETLTHNQTFASPQDALAHYGVKGMKWGVRKEKPPPGELILSQECKNGTQLNVYKDDRFSDDVDPYEGKAALYHAFEFRDRSGTPVGTASFYRVPPESTTLELEWIGVDKNHRSNGYARAALNGVIEYSKQNGITDLELSATKMGQPLYESLGFTRVPGKERKILGVFKTLPRYQLHIPAEVAHSDSVQSLLDCIVKAIDNDPELNDAEHSDSFENTLAHYGVKGMKWGVRNDKSGSGGSGKSSGTKEMSKDDISKAMDAEFAKFTKAELQAEGQRKLDSIAATNEFPSKRAAKSQKFEAQAAESDKYAQDWRKEAEKIGDPGKNLFKRYERKVYNDQAKLHEKERDALLKKAEQVKAGKLTDNQKRLLIAGAAVAATGLALYGTDRYMQRKTGFTPEKGKRALDENQRETARQWKEMFGTDLGTLPHAGSHYALLNEGSFYEGLASKKALSRPEFTIPKGTVFQRLSNHVEDATGYGGPPPQGAYATFLSNDKKSYSVSGEFGNKKYNVNFESEGETRVPSLTTVLSHLAAVRSREVPGLPQTPEAVFSEYRNLSGGNWSQGRGKSLIESLKSSGYGAIVDDMDAGYLGDLPVVYFGDAKSTTHVERTFGMKLEDSAALTKLARKYA